MNHESAQNLESFLQDISDLSSESMVMMSCVYFPEEERELVKEFFEKEHIALIDVKADDHPGVYLKQIINAIDRKYLVALNIYDFAPDFLSTLKYIGYGRLEVRLAGEEPKVLNLVDEKAKFVCLVNDKDYVEKDLAGLFGMFCRIES